MITDWDTPPMAFVQVKTQGSVEHWLKPQDFSQGNRERCQRRPACAIPYTGLRMRHTRVFPSVPVVS
eukprot:4956913-Pleurochrysis_carterae.AAC.1